MSIFIYGKIYSRSFDIIALSIQRYLYANAYKPCTSINAKIDLNRFHKLVIENERN